MAVKLAKAKIRNNHPSLHKKLHLARSVSFLSLAIVVMLGGYAYVSAAASGYTWADDEREFLTLVDNYRTSNGLGTLNRSGCATEAARAWSKSMANNNDLVHSSRTFFDNYCPSSSYSGWAENIHYNGNVYDNIPSVAFNGFKNSPGHNYNMLVSNWDQTGVGIFYDETHGKVWVTHIFIDCFDTCPSSVTSPPSDHLGGYQAVCSAIEAPSTVVAGSSFDATIRIKNTGGYRWLRGPITLVSKSSSADNWGKSSLPFALDGAPPLKPGWTGWFVSSSFRAPSASGSYDFAWRVKHSSAGEFGPTCKKTIKVTSASSGGGSTSNSDNDGGGASGSSETPSSSSNESITSQSEDDSTTEEVVPAEQEEETVEDDIFAPTDTDQPTNKTTDGCCVEPGKDTGFVESVKDRLDTPIKVVTASAVSLTAFGSALYGALHFRFFIRHLS